MNQIMNQVDKIKNQVLSQHIGFRGDETTKSEQEDAEAMVFIADKIIEAIREAGLINEANSGVALIAKERREQIEKHGRTVEHDIEKNGSGQIMRAARALIMAHRSDVIRHMYMPTDWDAASCMSMGAKPYKERLIIAGALIAAEIDRLQKLES